MSPAPSNHFSLLTSFCIDSEILSSPVPPPPDVTDSLLAPKRSCSRTTGLSVLGDPGHGASGEGDLSPANLYLLASPPLSALPPASRQRWS